MNILFSWKEFPIKLERLAVYLKANIVLYDGLIASEENLQIVFKDALSDDATQLIHDHWDSLTEESESTPTEEEIKQLVQISVAQAIDFGRKLLIETSAEFIIMGLIQSGKIVDIINYSSKINMYLQVGSLYAAVDELDNLITVGAAEALAPFITDERLVTYKHKIQDYLEIPQTWSFLDALKLGYSEHL